MLQVVRSHGLPTSRNHIARRIATRQVARRRHHTRSGSSARATAHSLKLGHRCLEPPPIAPSAPTSRPSPESASDCSPSP